MYAAQTERVTDLYRPLPSSTDLYRPLPTSTDLYRLFFPADAVARKEILARTQHVSPVAHDAGRRGEALQNHRAVAFRDDAPVQQHHSPHIHTTADQPTESLLQLQSGIRNEIVRESVQPACLQALEPRRRERLGRHLERELGEDQHAQGPPRHVNALPERIRSQENPRARFAKPPQQVITLPLALDEQR